MKNSSENKNKLLLVLDVDGVTRIDVHSTAYPPVIRSVHQLLDLSNKKPNLKDRIQIVFLSGSHAADVDIPHMTSEKIFKDNEWRRPNLSLSSVFRGHFSVEYFERGVIRILGQVGSDAAEPTSEASDLKGRIINGFTNQERLALLHTLLKSYGRFLKAHHCLSENDLNTYHALLAEAINKTDPETMPSGSSAYTPCSFEKLAHFVRSQTQDPIFRIVLHQACAELGAKPNARQGFPPLNLRTDGFKMIDMIQQDTDPQLHDRISGGVAHAHGDEFLWNIITKSCKGRAVHDLIARENNAPLVVTVGDSHVDAGMHKWADYAFHVGPPSTHVKMVETTGLQHLRHVALSSCKMRLSETLHGVNDPAALCCGTLEVIDRINHALAQQDDDNKSVDFSRLLKTVDESFTGV